MCKNRLTLQQQTFVHEYTRNGGNQTQAYIVAYPASTEDSADSNAYRLMENDGILKAITRHSERAARSAELTDEYIISSLMEQAERTDDKATHSANVKALETLGKYKELSMWTERIEHTVDDSLADRILRARNRDQSTIDQ